MKVRINIWQDPVEALEAADLAVDHEAVASEDQAEASAVAQEVDTAEDTDPGDTAGRIIHHIITITTTTDLTLDFIVPITDSAVDFLADSSA